MFAVKADLTHDFMLDSSNKRGCCHEGAHCRCGCLFSVCTKETVTQVKCTQVMGSAHDVISLGVIQSRHYWKVNQRLNHTLSSSHAFWISETRLAINDGEYTPPIGASTFRDRDIRGTYIIQGRRWSGDEIAKLGVMGCHSKGDGTAITDKEKSDTDSENQFLEDLWGTPVLSTRLF